jgi:hypothetical protein
VPGNFTLTRGGTAHIYMAPSTRRRRNPTNMLRILIGCVGVGVMLFAFASSASARNSFAVHLDCGRDGQMDVVTGGNGDWTPGRIVGGGVLHPTAFTNGHGTFVDKEGNVTNVDDPDSFKANPPANQRYVHCAFTLTFEDENGSGTFSGELDGWISAR